MVKKNYTPEQFPIPFPSGSSLPPDQADYLRGVYNNAASNYGLRSYGEAHPYKAALAGFFSGGLPGAINARATSDAYRRQAQEKDISGFTDAYKQALANQKDLDAINMPGNDNEDTQAIINEGQRVGLVSPSIPSISGQSLPGINGEPGTTTRRVHSKEFLNSYLQGAFGPSDLNYYQDASRQNANNFRNIGQNLTPSTTSNVDTNGIKTGINELNDTTKNVQAPFFVSDPKSIMQNLQQIQSAGLAQGTEKYKFDQQAPVRESQIAQNNAQALSAQQLAALHKIQANLEPKKVSAQANRDNAAAWRSKHAYLGGPAPQQPTTATERKAAYLSGAYGIPGSKEALQNYASALDNNPSGYSTVTENTLGGPDGKTVIGTKTSRVPIKATGSPPQPGITKHPIKGGGSVEY